MKPVLCVVLGLSLCAVALPVSDLAGEPHQQPRRQHVKTAQERHASLQVTFSVGDAARIIEHYSPGIETCREGSKRNCAGLDTCRRAARSGWDRFLSRWNVS